MSRPIFELRELEKTYNGQTVLRIDHLTVSPGSILGLVGPNGSGKSTLLKILGLIEKPDQGKILYNGKAVGPFSPEARFDITMLPQEPFLMKRSVFQNISYGLKLRGNTSDMVVRAYDALSLAGLPGNEFLNRPWYALSTGETQRVALAARLVLRPKVLLLDEPTASVDAASAQLIMEASLTARRDWGTTLIIAGHDRQWLDEICDSLLHLYKGRIIGSGRESLVFGPWTEFEEGKWGKRLTDGQGLRVTRPPERNATALIEGVRFSEDKTPYGPDDMVLEGVISRLTLRKSSGSIAVSVTAGDVPFIADLEKNQVEARSFSPGKNVFIHYNVKKIQWIGS